MLFINLETERLLLENISTKDREFLFNEFTDDVINKYLYDAEPFADISEADEIIDFYTVPEPRAQHRWIIRRKSDNVQIGTCGFHCWNIEKGTVEIGYEMKQEYWGNGYMREAIISIIDFAKNNMNAKEISAHIYIENERSRNLAKKLGFKVTGKYNEIFRGKEYPHDIYTLYL